MLNEGTKPHTIKPKRKFLVYRTPFRSKTLPNQIMSRAGSKGGKLVMNRDGVQHPGTVARKWNRVIATKWQARVGVVFQQSISGVFKGRGVRTVRMVTRCD